jgi:hypothetical protein
MEDPASGCAHMAGRSSTGQAVELIIEPFSAAHCPFERDFQLIAYASLNKLV